MDSPAPLHSQLSDLSLDAGSHGALQDEDLTLTLGDDSFDQQYDDQDDDTEEQRLPPPVGLGGSAGAGSSGGTDVAFGGSMGALPPPSLPSPSRAGPGSSTTPGRSSNERTTEDEGDADSDLDLDLLAEGGEGGEGSGISEEERKRIVELREERDGLRGMNRTLEGLLAGLRGMDSKLKVSGTL